MSSPNNVAYDYDTMATSTLALMRKRIADQIFKANNTAAFFLASGRVQREDGGKWIEEPLLYSKNDTVQPYVGYEPLTVQPTEELTMARFNWRQVAGSVVISGLEELQNAGRAQVFNMLKQKIMVLEMSMKEYFDEKIHAATATKDLTRDFLGLAEIIENQAGASQGSLGGIDRGTYTWWRNQRQLATDYSFLGATNAWSARAMTKAMINFMNTCSKNHGTKTKLLLTTQALYENFEYENHDLLRLQSSDRNMLDVGFDNYRFKGATMMWNENAPANLMYFINPEYMRFVIHSRRNFVMTPFAKPINQDAKTAQMLWAGNMTCGNNRFQGVLDFTGAAFNATGS